MKELKFLTVLAFFLAVPAGAQSVRPQQIFERGKASLESGDTVSAVKRLKIASFGLLNDPQQYANALVYLSVALHRSGDMSGAEKAIEKLAEVERIKPVLADLDIPPMIYIEFSKFVSTTSARTPLRFLSINMSLKNRELLTKQREAQLGSEDRN